MFDYINNLNESQTEDKLLEYMLDPFIDSMRSIEISLLKDRIESFRRYRMENPA
jgi:hypothetical protein